MKILFGWWFAIPLWRRILAALVIGVVKTFVVPKCLVVMNHRK